MHSWRADSHAGPGAGVGRRAAPLGAQWSAVYCPAVRMGAVAVLRAAHGHRDADAQHLGVPPHSGGPGGGRAATPTRAALQGPSRRGRLAAGSQVAHSPAWPGVRPSAGNTTCSGSGDRPWWWPRGTRGDLAPAWQYGSQQGLGSSPGVGSRCWPGPHWVLRGKYSKAALLFTRRVGSHSP